jgi:CHAT domain
MPRILFLTAGNVTGQDRLRVAREARAVRAAITTVDPDYADLRVEADVGTDELVEIVLSVMPDIIHFSGHGAPGQAHFDNGALSAATISRIVAQVPEIWCVVLNSCYSDSIAKRLVNDGVPAVVGMTDAISDDAAIEFSRFFYRALAAGPDIKRAVEQSRVSLLGPFPDESSTPCEKFGDLGKLAERSRRHARPELRARFCVDDNGLPEVWEDDDETVFVPFDLFVENAPTSASSVIYRLHESYSESADGPENGQFHEATVADDKFYLGRIDSEDDYTVEAYIRWNDGRVRMIKRNVTEALSAYYKSLSAEDFTAQLVNTELIDKTIAGLRNGNLQMRRPVPRKTTTKQKRRPRTNGKNRK